MKIINGNIRNNIKIMQWNKGQIDLTEKIEEVKDLINNFKPEILVINDANFNSHEDISLIKIKGFSLEVDNLMNDHKVNRTVIYIKENICYQRKHKYETKNESSITIAIGYQNMKKIWLTGHYRQFQLINKNKERSTTSISDQNFRFINQVNLWNKMINENPAKEYIFTGDFNLDALKWSTEKEKLSSYDRKQLKIS